MIILAFNQIVELYLIDVVEPHNFRCDGWSPTESMTSMSDCILGRSDREVRYYNTSVY